ncbi:MAG: hypothetical protein U0X76_13380 [Bacteroidia bacterium]
MDSAFHNTDSLFYAGSVTGGPSAHNLVATPEGNYVVSIKTFTGAGTGQSLGQKNLFACRQRLGCSSGYR